MTIFRTFSNSIQIGNYIRIYIIFNSFFIMKKKTISLPEDLYYKLKRQKKKGETFPDLIERLIKEKISGNQQLKALAGALMEDIEWDNILHDIYEDRKRATRI